MIQSGLTAQAKLDFLMGVHQPEDTYKIALYGPSASLNTLIKRYTTAGEVRGKGYQRGGRVLEGYQAVLEGVSAYLTWTKNPTWPVSTIEAAGALIYNASKDNRAILVLAFDGVARSTNGKFVIPLPEADASRALIRLP